MEKLYFNYLKYAGVEWIDRYFNGDSEFTENKIYLKAAYYGRWLTSEDMKEVIKWLWRM